ncbi:MAG: filamentous hemagglutinin family protein [Verrucomicrobiales bacterium]|jgi:filamentous hemagglutinin family protein
MPRRAPFPHLPFFAVPLLTLGLGCNAQSQSLCDDFHVPAAHIGNFEGCVATGNTTTITFNGSAVLEWDRGFNIRPDQDLRFTFAGGARGAVLNRDISGGNSNIAGTVTSNGRALLINPSRSIFIQPGALIDADGGFLASTLDTADDDTLINGGGGEFNGGGFLTGINNDGTIRSTNGDIILISNAVINADTGRISAPSGSVHIGAGTRIRLAAAGEPRIAVLDGDGQHSITNNGAINAANVIDLSVFASSPILPGQRNPAIENNGIIRTTTRNGRVFLRALPGNSQILNSSTGTIETANLILEGDPINEGAIIEPDDGSNPSAPSGTRQFPRLTSSALAETANSDFRLSRLSFSHLNGLESKTKKKSKSAPKKKAVIASNTATTRGSGTADQNKKATASGKKIVLRRGTFFGKKTQ